MAYLIESNETECENCGEPLTLATESNIPITSQADQDKLDRLLKLFPSINEADLEALEQEHTK